VYACWVKQHFTAQDFFRLLDTLHHLSLRVKQLQHAHAQLVYSIQAQATLVMLAGLLAMLPVEGQQADWVQSKEVEARVLGISATDYPYSAVVQLVWGLVVASQPSSGSALPSAALKQIEAGIEGGVLSFVYHGVLESVPMQDEPETIRHMAATVVFQSFELLMEHAR
jgi:hypothetical protein